MGAFRYSEISLMSIDLRASYRQARPAMLSVGNCCQAAAMVRNRVANLDSLPKHDAEFVEPMECALVSKLGTADDIIWGAAARMLVRCTNSAAI
jgi:hypothetical protein